MKLTDLNPKLEGTLDEGFLRFNCPLGHDHKIRVPVGRYGDRRGWEASGEYPTTVTLTPSIHAITTQANTDGIEPCGWHGFITNGDVK